MAGGSLWSQNQRPPSVSCRWPARWAPAAGSAVPWRSAPWRSTRGGGPVRPTGRWSRQSSAMAGCGEVGYWWVLVGNQVFCPKGWGYTRITKQNRGESSSSEKIGCCHHWRVSSIPCPQNFGNSSYASETWVEHQKRNLSLMRRFWIVVIRLPISVDSIPVFAGWKQGYGPCGRAALSALFKVMIRQPFCIIMRDARVQLCRVFYTACPTVPIGSSQEPRLHATNAILGSVLSAQQLFQVHLISWKKNYVE